MAYQADGDYYVCKNGRKLNCQAERQIKRQNGYQSKAKIYVCESCEGCPYLGSCYKGKYAKTLQVNERFDPFRANSLDNIRSEQGTQLRVNRSIQAEGVFGVTKQDMGFTRFLTRGQVNVRTEYLLLALGFNINKLHHRLQKKRFKQALFKLKNTA